MANRFVSNAISYHGKGAIQEIPGIVTAKGFQKAFIASDPDLVKFGVTKKVTDILDAAGLAYEIYSDIKANPTIENVQHGVDAYRACGADFMITIGGGSSMDTGKGIGIIVNNPEFSDVRSLEGVAPTKNRAVPTFAIPTTAGTAADVTINYVITDEEAKKKMVCVDPNDIPVCAVIDCELMMSMPKGLTASTGLDALTHAIESYITPGAWTMSDMFEYKAIELIHQHLYNAVQDGNDVKAREGMAEAQYIAGMGFSNVGLGIVHSMAHQLGAVYDTPHGIANAVILPYVLEYFGESAYPRLAKLADVAGITEAGMSEADLDALLQQIIETEYRHNPQQMQRMIILGDLEPYRHLTRAEVQALYDKNLITIEELLIKLNFADFVRRFERENMNIITFGENIDYDTKIDTIKERLTEYAREIIPQQKVEPTNE